MARAALFSSVGDPPLSPLVQAAHELSGGPAPTIAYVPAATTGPDFVDLNRRAFAGVGNLQVVGLQSAWQPSDADRSIIEAADLIYIPGGNTYLLAERLERSGLRNAIVQRLRAGRPLLAFSAGSVYCGPTILSTNDWNVTGSTCFDGLGLVPFHITAHFPSHELSPDLDREDRIAQLVDFRATTVLAMEDGASLHIDGSRCTIGSGVAWLFTAAGEAPDRLTSGDDVPLPAGG